MSFGVQLKQKTTAKQIKYSQTTPPLNVYEMNALEFIAIKIIINEEAICR